MLGIALPYIKCSVVTPAHGEGMEKLLDWAEKNGLENLRFRIQNAETLAKEASSTLTLTLAAMGGTLAYGVKGLEGGVITPLISGTLAITVWLAACAMLMVFRCIQTRDLVPPTNEPSNIFQPEHSLDDLRRVELKNIQSRIVQTTTRNQVVAYWLDKCRLMLAFTPVVFLVGFACMAVVDRVFLGLVAG